MNRLRIPTATYRLQLGRHLNFAGVAALADYLDLLGVSDLYLSPIQAARPGSLHGYDVVDHACIDPGLGTDEDIHRLAERLRERGMGIVVDVVPNHMCVAHLSNHWWSDVLENGPSSPASRCFDIDWNPPKPDLVAKVLLPVLGDQYGRVLESGGITIAYDAGAFVAHTHGMTLPVAPRTWHHLLEPALDDLRRHAGDDNPDVMELESVLLALRHLPPRTETDSPKVRERQREKEIIKRRLAALVDSSAAARAAVEQSVVKVNGRLGDPRSFDDLEALLADQAYRLSFWRVASDEINYRRFFDVNELAAIRVEEPAVFAAVHDLLLRLVADGTVTGLRIDHVDGLRDPDQYLRDLARACRTSTANTAAGESSLRSTVEPPLWVVVEKILMGNEMLRASWPVAGTTGYEFLNAQNGLFVQPAGAEALRRSYEAFTGLSRGFADVVYESKKLILRVSLSSELTMLARQLDRISEQHRFSRDFTLRGMQEALSEFLACLPVYRTYIREGDTHAAIGPDDRRYVDEAIDEAKHRNPALSESVFDFLRAVLLLDDPEGLEETDRMERRDFVMRLQQLTGPVMAKGVEDTAFYRYHPLASLNEVGGDPARFGIELAEFHRMNAGRLRHSPHGMSTTSTHDTKRSEDVRACINVLSEVPEAWASAVSRWREMLRPHKTNISGLPAPRANDEYLFYQTLVGAWPLEPLGDDAGRGAFIERIQRYMEKATREAKVHTSWVSPNGAFDRALSQFVARALDPALSPAFVADVAAFVATVQRPGLYSAVSQALLKIASPGVPDFYQGSELHRLLLVDPDNRRPVDFARRHALLKDLLQRAERDARALSEQIVVRPEDGRLKLFITSRALSFRRRRRKLFERGDYIPLDPAGTRAGHAIAFARATASDAVVVAAGRFFVELKAAERPPIGPDAWGGTFLPLAGAASGSRWHDVLTGEMLDAAVQDGVHMLPLERVFGSLPVALLERTP